ncbi:UNVERIFIED_CONTAM: hypothetical protein RMT77_008061 [Armadillidium vulgare]
MEVKIRCLTISLLSVVLLNSVNISSANVDYVFSQFAKDMFLESCLGKETIKYYIDKVTEAVNLCATPQQQFDVEDVDVTLSPVVTQTPTAEDFWRGNNFLNWPLNSFQPRTSLRTSNRRVVAIPFPMRAFDLEDFFFRRNKRETELIFNDKVVKDLKDKIENHVGNLTCILQNMNYINEKKQIELEYIKGEVKNLGFDKDLEFDLLEGIDICTDMTTCLPVKRMKTALSENLKRVMHFIKCSEEQRNLACLKHTLRRERNKFQTQELNEGLFSLLQEDERLLAIIWSNYLTKVPEQYAYDMVY